ncbi:DNA primase [Paraurantiacibacter namhicola]|uniref:DNA primase n=1 Tax=Paraurantiacibacter namhicola TaxID=645517 RepID=A0A1C7D9C8_9SPHN|nr:DNA primase [Paraurantiacibacter namhicola]ANU07921.1 DNA primase [Paraurantiacibacter namhicola]
MALSPQWLDELRARVTLSTVIMRTDKLQRAGREWKACCPFHEEKTPSFTVNDQKGFYHCFGCGAHGDVIRWMTDQRGMAFMDAVKELAAEAGLDVPAPDPRAAERAEKRAGLHDVTAAAQDWFRTQLHNPAGAEALAYLRRRGLSDHVIERFGFGWAPEDRNALSSALDRFDTSMLVESGMLIAVDGKAPYSRFRGRVTLPIQDARERVVGFGGRILADVEGAPKYLNSPETPLFDKGRTLYNIHRAAAASRKTDRVIVVEGYMDVIALAAAGFEEAVAPLGTALTENQIGLLWRMVDRPVLCFDGDKAGQRAAMRAIGRALPLLQPGKSLSFVVLPTGLDPDDLLQQQGAGAMEALLGKAHSLLDMLWLFERDAAPLSSPEDKAGLKQRLIEHCEAIQHPDIKALYRRDLMDRFSDFAFPKREFQPRQPFAKNRPWSKPGRAEPVSARLKQLAALGTRDAFLRAIIAGLARHPHEIAPHAEALANLQPGDPNVAAAIETLLDVSETLEATGQNPISGADSLVPVPDNTRFSFLMEGSDPQTVREDLAEAIALLVERPAIEQAIVQTTARFDSDPEGAFAEQQRLRKRKLEIEARLGQMARKRAGAAAPEHNQDIAPAHAAGSDEQMD